MEERFLNTSYLREGNPRQRNVYKVLRELAIFEHLAEYGPLLAGTVPLGIDIGSSDLDIVCGVHDRASFCKKIFCLYHGFDNFEINCDDGREEVLCSFDAGNEKIEIFASPVPSRMSNAFRHMVAESRILEVAGPEFCGRVIALKQSGIKTEPAFAAVMGLAGDPYDEILRIYDLSDPELEVFLKSRTGVWVF